MSADDDQGAGADLEREIRQRRKFTPEEAIGRLAGSGAMKGASAVSRVQQAEIEVGTWLKNHIADAAGALSSVLYRQLKGSELLLDNLDQPSTAARAYCESVLGSNMLLHEIVRQADVEWGRIMDERPHFDREGVPPDPEDAYTIESVRKALCQALARN